MTELDSTLSPSAKARDFLLLSGPRYIACVALFMHLPFGLAVGQAHWLDIVLPSIAMTCLNFLIPHMVARFGKLVGAVCFLSLSIVQVFWLSASCGGASGLHYFFFSISVVAIYVFRGFPPGWGVGLATAPAILFAVIEILVPADGLTVAISPALAPWLGAANALGSFTIIALMSILFSRVASEAELLLAAEKDRSERLLLNILPAPIAARLKAGTETVIADRIDEVSVLFADLVGFTPYAHEREPTAVVGMLNTLFSRFDAQVDALGLEKIKTVGDAYMVVAGAPVARADHLAALARLALALVDEVATFRDDSGQRFAIRVGLHIGPVVTGVIGTRKMAYDVWGDTVNVASRLESSSLPGCVHVSPQVMERLGGHFRFEQRESIEIKGVGLMTTYFLTAAASA